MLPPLTTQSCLMQPIAGKPVGVENSKGPQATFSSINKGADRSGMYSNEYKTENSGRKLEKNKMVLEDLNVGLQKKDGTHSLCDVRTAAMPNSTGKCCQNLQGQEDGALGDSKLSVICKPETEYKSKDACNENHSPGTEAWAPTVHAFQQYKAPGSSVLNLTSPCMKEKEPSLFVEEEEKKIKLELPVSSNEPLGKRESMSENDLALLDVINSSGAMNEIIALESTSEVKSCSKNLGEVALPVNHCQSESVQRGKRKDKGKALLDSDVKRTSNEEEDGSQESVESCNSARSPVTGKKRRILEKHFVVGSKRVKKQAEDSPSICHVRQESSFMNWIWNILKGLSRSDQDDPSSLAVTLTHPASAAVQSQDQKLLTCAENQDTVSRVGFHSLFQSSHWPGLAKQDAREMNVQCQMEEATEELVLKNVTFNQVKCGDEAGPSTAPLRSSATFPVIQETGHAERENLHNMARGKENDRVSPSNSYLGKHRMNSAENKDFDFRSARHGSLWITRFTSKHPSSAVNADHCGHRTRGLEGGLLNDVGKETQKCAAHSESSFGLKRLKWTDSGKFIGKPKPELDSLLTFRTSKAMASVFARRLDALKEIIQSTETDNPVRTAGICLFCGGRGHCVQDCSELTVSELEELLRNLHAIDRAEESPSLCIKCLQLNHWAIACPLASSRRRCQSEYDASLVRHSSPGISHLNTEKEINPELMEHTERLHFSGLNVHCRSHPRMESEFALNFPRKVISTLDKGKRIASSIGKNSSLCSYARTQISEVPIKIFDAIRKLRLSRADTLKWMNSSASLLLLDGYFLRVRLRKQEEGPGGTGYHVACISEPGTLRNRATQCIGGDQVSVNVGGMKCLVRSQYISNHDFLEDELLAWWSTTLRGGGEIPSEEDLRMKFEGKKELGL